MLRCIFTVLTASVDNKVVIVVLFHFSYDLRFQVAWSHVLKLSLPLWEYKYNNYASRFVTLAPWLTIQGDLGE